MIMRVIPRRRSRRWAAVHAAEVRLPADTTLERQAYWELKRSRDFAKHRWFVKAQHADGMLYIFNLDLSFSQAYLINLRTTSDVLWKVRRAGGELLERYFISRGKWDEAAYYAVKRDARGEVLPCSP